MLGRLPPVVALAAACASGGASGGTTPTPYTPSSAQVGDRPAQPPKASDLVRYGPNALRYVVRRQLHIQQGLAQQTHTQDLGTRTFLTVAMSGPPDNIGYPTTFTVDSIVADSGTPTQIKDNLDRAKRLVFSGRVASGGEFVNGVPSDNAAAQSLIQLLGGFRDFLPRIPRAGLELGTTWSDTLDRSQKGGGRDVTFHTVVQGRATAWEDYAGTRSLRLAGTVSYTVAGTAQTAGQPVQIAGQGTGTGVSFIAADGRFMGAESRDSANLTYRFLNEGVTLPVVQVTRTTVAVLP